jgi:tRNA pseudouridine13 synthase
MGKLIPPVQDLYIGMEEYKSSGEGIGGRIKESPGDFRVAEVTATGKVLDFEKDEAGDGNPGDYTHFTLVKENWETLRALKEIAKRVGVSQDRFAFAGTKDKHALTAQRVSAYRVQIERLRQVRLKDITLKDFSYADENLGLGSLWGNKFDVVVRGVCDGSNERITAIASDVEPGFPNYYGHQRFGDVRPITHEVGKLMLKGDFEAAVMTYVSRSFEGEDEDTMRLRQKLATSRDFKEALESFPMHLGYEKAILNHLVQVPGDWVGAIRQLPKNLQRMFVHAYQSHVFNRALSECIRRSLTVEKLPLVGVEVPPDPISAHILEADGIKPQDFRLMGMGELRSKGEYRSCFEPAFDLAWSLHGDFASFSFRLPKGCYATVFLREFMKEFV